MGEQLKCNIARSKRSLITQLKLGILGLEVETGRYTSTPRQDRICKLCRVECEDELHFIFRCPKLYNERLELYKKNGLLLQKNNEIERLKLLLNKPFMLSNYLCNLWHRRQELLKSVK